MVKKKENLNHSWFYLSIVSIVAIVAIILIFHCDKNCNGENIPNLDDSSLDIVEVTDENGNIVGEAFMFAKNKYSTTKRYQLKPSYTSRYMNLNYEAHINPLFLRCLSAKKNCISEAEFSVGETKNLELSDGSYFQLQMTQMNDFGAYFSYVGGGGILHYQSQCRERSFGQNKVSLLSYSYRLNDTSSNKVKVCVY
jgi:hypothetical protein